MLSRVQGHAAQQAGGGIATPIGHGGVGGFVGAEGKEQAEILHQNHADIDIVHGRRKSFAGLRLGNACILPCRNRGGSIENKGLNYQKVVTFVIALPPGATSIEQRSFGCREGGKPRPTRKTQSGLCA
jgi:hypothetical protein